MYVYKGVFFSILTCGTFIAIVSLVLTYQVGISTLASTVLNHFFINNSHLNALISMQI